MIFFDVLSFRFAAEFFVYPFEPLDLFIAGVDVFQALLRLLVIIVRFFLDLSELVFHCLNVRSQVVVGHFFVFDYLFQAFFVE